MAAIMYPGSRLPIRVGDVVCKSAGSKLYQVTQVAAGAVSVSAVRLKGIDSGGSFWVYPAATTLRLVEAAPE